LERAQLDITDAVAVSDALETLRPRVVINCAAYTDVDGCEHDPDRASLVNAHGASAVAQSAHKIGARLIHLSTDYVFSGESTRPYHESDTPNPVQTYGRTKLDGEHRVADTHDNAVIVRTSWLCGPTTANFVTVIADRLRGGHHVEVVHDQFGCLTHVDDLADALVHLTAADSASGSLTGIAHLINPGRWSRYELAVAIAGHLEIDPINVRPVSTDQLVPARPARRPACVELISTRPISALPNGSDALARLLDNR
jgi:dTDP-4-dehydrorhamnose reductase